MGDLTAALAASVPTETHLLSPFEASDRDARCAGPAVTANGTPGDNLVLYRALEAARPGDVLVVAIGPAAVAGHWGGLLTRAALRAGVAGLVIDGSIRDVAEIAQLGLPVFFRGRSPRKAVKRGWGTVNDDVTIDDVVIRADDWIVADGDGVVVVRSADIDRVRTEAHAIEQVELGIEQRIAAGDELTVAFNLPAIAAD
jgi:4-hydroxy-4-methyl-2-oxoglutarate aldolase